MLKVYDSATLKSLITEPFDVFICSSSFEERSKSAAEVIEPDLFSQALVCINQNNVYLAKKNAEFLINRFGKKTQEVLFNSTNPLTFADNVATHLKQTKKEHSQRYLVDITTFTRECLLILLGLLRLILKQTDILYFIYNLASNYSLEDSIENKWLAKGISDIRSVLSYSGDWRPSRKIHLIILVGIEYERATKLIGAFEPASVTLGFCEDAETIKLTDLGLNKLFYERLKNSYLNVNNSFLFPCLDPMQTKNMILEQTKSNYNVVVASLNNKVSTLGAGLAAIENKSIQLCYAQANQYNFDNYSLPSDRFCLFELQGLLAK